MKSSNCGLASDLYSSTASAYAASRTTISWGRSNAAGHDSGGIHASSSVMTRMTR